LIGWPGFAAAMSTVGWLEEDAESLVLPEFDTHNGQSAKRRAQDADRKREVRTSSASDADKKRTREEKRRKNKPPISPVGGLPGGGDEDEDDEDDDPVVAKKPAIELQTYIDDCKAQGVPPIREGDPVFKYVDEVGIPHDFLRLQWLEFKDRYIAEKKRQKNWPQKFSNSVRGNWFHLWRVDTNGQYLLTTQGQQAQKLHQGKA
jgi:hypothetical protein